MGVTVRQGVRGASLALLVAGVLTSCSGGVQGVTAIASGPYAEDVVALGEASKVSKVADVTRDGVIADEEFRGSSQMRV